MCYSVFRIFQGWKQESTGANGKPAGQFLYTFCTDFGHVRKIRALASLLLIAGPAAAQCYLGELFLGRYEQASTNQEKRFSCALRRRRARATGPPIELRKRNRVLRTAPFLSPLPPVLPGSCGRELHSSGHNVRKYGELDRRSWAAFASSRPELHPKQPKSH